MVHFRLTTPVAMSDAVRDFLLDNPSITNLTVQPGAVVKPAGDLIECDVAREHAGEVLTCLRELGVHEQGGIVITAPTGTPFEAARQLEEDAPGHPDDAVIWESVESYAEAGAVPTLSFHVSW